MERIENPEYIAKNAVADSVSVFAARAGWADALATATA